MKRLLALFAVLLLGAGLAACGDDDDGGAVASDSSTTTTEALSSTTTTAAAADGATVAVADSSLGKILVDGDGMTLYMFKPDTVEESKCVDTCAQIWPALTGTAIAGDGADESKLATAPRADGAMQVTYNGHRLYLYSGDKAAGDTTGQDVGDVWYVVGPDGEPITE
jgi:predicted lipoprotein with Yx(FWY)xxD motif